MKRQMELGVYGEIKNDVSDVNWGLVALCETKADAYRLCMNFSRTKRSDASWAELLGISKSHLSQILNPRADSPKYMPWWAEIELIRLSGNRAVQQFLDLASQGRLQSQKSESQREQELLRELAELRAAK